MKRLITLLTTSLIVAVLVPSFAFAAKPTGPGPQPGNVSELVGYDVSYPQCGKSLPTDQYFGIPGVNGGTAASTNPCLSQQLAWANSSKTGSNQPKVQVYINTANPGELISQISTWPSNNTDKTGFTTQNPYGTCAGTNDRACSWQYGWNRAVEANIDRFVPAANAAGINQSASAYTWWLDVETMNTWQSGSQEALIRNTATLEGMTSYLNAQSAKVGLYSTAAQWSQITGNNIAAFSNLNGLPNWRPSGSNLANAKANCGVTPLTAGGFISLTQYVVKGLDNNHSCI